MCGYADIAACVSERLQGLACVGSKVCDVYTVKYGYIRSGFRS
jgi:hypothetical protein